MPELALHIGAHRFSYCSFSSVAGYLRTQHEKRRTRGGHRHAEGGPRRRGAADPLRDPGEDITGSSAFLSSSSSSLRLSFLCIYFSSLRPRCLTFDIQSRCCVSESVASTLMRRVRKVYFSSPSVPSGWKGADLTDI